MHALTQSFLHFQGIGPSRADALADCGVREWQDLLDIESLQLPFSKAFIKQLTEEARANIVALQDNNLVFFIERLDNANRWRLLHDFWDQCTYLDIETSGLELDAQITVISCWNGRELHAFVNGENLEEFPDYLLSIPLMVTFNGSTFDLPVIRRYFNLPDIPVPHIDMRWICRNCDLTGGLKPIEHQLNLKRPNDLVGTDGSEAIALWNRWEYMKDASARAKLIRYCAADTIALQHVAAIILAKQSGDEEAFALDTNSHWQILNEIIPVIIPSDTSVTPAKDQHDMKSETVRQQTVSSAQEPRLSALQQRLRAFLDTRKGNIRKTQHV
ncbi:MAG: ribonuclease H-like domain-containing protein [Victivallales bacterium]|nr:ribonuclease H-like domain-containing protein [Victivallales bacterium]